MKRDTFSSIQADNYKIREHMHVLAVKGILFLNLMQLYVCKSKLNYLPSR